MNRALVIIGVVLLVLLAAYLVASWYFSDMIVKFDTDDLAEERAEHGDPAGYGLPAPEEVQIPANGVTLAGWYFENPGEGDCGVVLMHGITGSRYGMLKYAPLFWPRGCDLLIYDHRYHGGSTGEYGTYGFYEKRDTLVALEWFAQRSGLPINRIGMMGESYGAATALEAAALEPGVAFVAADSAYGSLEAIVGEQAVQLFGPALQPLVPGALVVAGLRAGFDTDQVAPVEIAGDIQVPVFLSHSATDEYTVPRHSEEIYGQLREAGCHRLHLTGWGSKHADSIDDDFGAYQAQVEEFLSACVPGFGDGS